jgi:DNA gyrase/topoisomerase IV subunit A
VAGIRLAAGDRVVAAGVAGGDVLLVLHETGHGKLVPLDAYPVQGRGSGGVQSADPAGPRKAPAGPVAAAATIGAGGTAMALTAAGGLQVIGGDLEPASRAAVSRRLVELAAGDEVVAAIPLI